MTLTDIAQNIKRWSPFLVLFLIAVALVLLVFGRKAKEPPKPSLPPLLISTSSSSTQPEFFDFSNLPKIQVPNKLGVYKIETSKFTKDQAINLAVRLGFNPNPGKIIPNTTTGTLYSWSDEKRSLDVSEQVVRYTMFLKYVSGLEPVRDVALTEKEASKFLTETGFLAGLQINQQQTHYFKKENSQLLPVGQEVANVVQFSFQQTIDGLPLVGENPALGQIIVRVDGLGKIIFFQVESSLIYNKLTDSPLKRFDQATSKLKEGEGVIVKSSKTTKGGLEEIGEQPGFQIAKAAFKKVYLAYYYPIPTPDLVQPIFVFEGEFEDKSGQRGELVLYLPAIEERVTKTK